MSSRSRNTRNHHRASSGGNQEEIALWNELKSRMKDIIDAVNDNNDATREQVALEVFIASNEANTGFDQAAEDAKLEGLLRSGVKSSASIKDKIDDTVEQLRILQALTMAHRQDNTRESQASGTPTTSVSGRGRSGSALLAGSSRGRTGNRDKERERDRDKVKVKAGEPDPYDFDASADSPVPSPVGPNVKRYGRQSQATDTASAEGGGPGSDRSGNRDSLPPQDDDTPLTGPGGTPPLSALVSSQNAKKQTFVVGQEVVVKPKPTDENPDPTWILGRVTKIIGEGKSRRYRVQDADPDLPPSQRTEFRLAAVHIIPIPNPVAELAALEIGKTVLAEYPETTTFYQAEVMGTDQPTGKVRLKFAGEENNETFQLVERRKVVEFRN